MVVRAPWTTLPGLLSDPAVGQALRLSPATATLATAVSIVLGVPLAWVLARVRWRPGPGRGRRPDVPADVTPDAVAEPNLAAGSEIWVSVKATELSVYPV